MARSDRLRAMKTGRIRSSEQRVTVVLRDAVNGAAQVVAPSTVATMVSPLTGKPRTPTAQAPAIAGSASYGSIGPLPCLWYDTSTVDSLRRGQSALGATTVAGADAYCEVEITPDVQTTLGTIFDDAAYIEHAGRQYTVLKVSYLGAGDALPYSLVVWVRARVGQ